MCTSLLIKPNVTPDSIQKDISDIVINNKQLLISILYYVLGQVKACAML